MHFLALRLAIGHLRQRPLARLFVIASVACILLINSFLVILFQSFSDSLAEVKAARYMTAYIETSVPSSREGQVVSGIRKIPGVAHAELVSKDAFVKKFSKLFPQVSGELAAVDNDAIPRYIKIKLRTADKDMPLVKASVEKLNGVETVEMNSQRFSGVIKALGGLKQVVAVLFAGMNLALACVLLNHFKLSTQLAEQVRRTLSLLGSKRSFIVLPFAIEGALEGGLGGGLAAAAIMIFGRVFEGQINEVTKALGYMPHHYDLWPLAIGVTALGLVLGMIGSLWVLFRVRS